MTWARRSSRENERRNSLLNSLYLALKLNRHIFAPNFLHAQPLNEIRLSQRIGRDRDF